MTWRSIYKLLEVEEKKGELSKKEERRLKEFKEKKAKLDALPYQPCVECGKKLVPVPMEFCSSKCVERHKKRKLIS